MGAGISLVIMLVVVIFFVTDRFPSAIVALAGLVLMLLFQCCSIEDALSGFSSDIFLLVLGMSVIGQAFFHSGIALLIGKYLLNWFGGNERLFIFVSCCISAMLSALFSNSAVIVLMMTVCQAISAGSADFRYKNIVIPNAVAAILGGHCTLMGSTTQLLASKLLQEECNLAFGTWDLIKVCGPITLILILYMTFAGYKMGIRVWGRNEDQVFHNWEMNFQQARLTSEGKRFLIILFLVIILFVTGWMNVGVTAVLGAVLCVFAGCIDQKTIFSEIDWNGLIWLCSCLGLGKAVSASEGTEIIAVVLNRLFGKIPAHMSWLLFALVVLATMFISEFMSNMACLLMIMPSILNMAAHIGLNPFAFAYGMCLGAALTYLTPLANGHIGMTVSAGYKFSDYVRYGLIPSALAYLLIVVLTPVFYPLR